ncbi:MAG TPA: gamma-glutamyl-phosphate reductase, partial [Sphingomonadaceae bacterium]|nr:gamma-glutamyl-phosphate reductase [Sphingomonadaceae bacterium]
MTAASLTRPRAPDAAALPDATALIVDMAARARAAAVTLARTDTARKAAALEAAAEALRRREPEILAANAKDVAAGAANGLSGAMLDRLKLDPKRLEGIAGALEAVAA